MRQMIRKLRDRLENRLPALALILIVIQPALDVFSYFMAEWGRSSISTALRFLLLAFVAALGFLLSDKKKVYYLFYGGALLFWVLHAANCFRTGYVSPVADAGNYLRILNFPIFTLSLITLLERGEAVRKRVYLGFAIALGELVLFTALPWLLGRPVYTYTALEVGVLGWFSVPSAQSAIIVLVVPLALYWAYQTKKYAVFLLAALVSFGLMFVTGTKLTFYSIFIIAGAYAFLFAIRLKKRSLKYALPLLAAAVAVFAFRHQSPMALREQMTSYHQGLYDNLVKNSLENSGDESTITLIRSGKVGAASDDRLERVRRTLMGVYADRDVYGVIFSDLYDRFGVYNVMAAYHYTAEPYILSDSRVRKRTFAQLMWEEKDFLTRWVGFEYSDMLMGGSIYDLENDFPALFYFCGYLGFALYMLFFVYFAVLVLRTLIAAIVRTSRERKDRPGRNQVFKGLGSCWQGLVRFLTLETGAVGMTFLLGVIAAQISGNVLRRPNVTVYFAAAAACLYQLCRAKEDPPSEEEDF